MAIALRAVGAPVTDPTVVTAVAPAVPVGATTGDLSILSVVVKPFGATITTPAGWTKITERTNGTVATSGADVGSVKVAVYVQESATVGAIPALTLGGSPDSATAVINTYSKSAGDAWDFSVFTGGDDNVAHAAFLITGGAIATATGDWVVATVGMAGDAGNPSTRAVGGMSGDTITATARVNSGMTTGFDTRVIVADAQVTAGSSAAAPTYSHTMTTTFPTGSAVFLRLRTALAAVAAPVPPILLNQTAIDRAVNW